MRWVIRAGRRVVERTRQEYETYGILDYYYNTIRI